MAKLLSTAFQAANGVGTRSDVKRVAKSIQHPRLALQDAFSELILVLPLTTRQSLTEETKKSFDLVKKNGHCEAIPDGILPEPCRLSSYLNLAMKVLLGIVSLDEALAVIQQVPSSTRELLRFVSDISIYFATHRQGELPEAVKRAMNTSIWEGYSEYEQETGVGD